MMIQARELRIDNYILFKQFGKGKGKIGQMKPGDFGRVKCDDPEESEYHPIPITPEWLERCGFEKGDAEEITHGLEKGEDYYWHNGRLIWWHGLQNKATGERYEHIKHVHELQNIYRWLTGEELNVKL